MVMIGLNPTEVRDLAATMRQYSEMLQNIPENITSHIAHSTWIGSDAEQFRQQWTRHSIDLRNAAEALQTTCQSLERQAIEQETASAADTVGYDSGSRVVSQISFDDEKEYGEVDPDVANAWQHMTPEERQKLAQEIVNDEFKKYNLDPTEITFANEYTTADGRTLTGYNGLWDESQKTLVISPERLNQSPYVLNTLAHEARHAAQHHIIRETDISFWDFLLRNDKSDELKSYGVTRDQVDSWKENFDNYVSPPPAPANTSDEEWTKYREEFQRYMDQPVEVDARKSGRDFINGFAFEDLQEYQRKAGIRVSEKPR